MKKSSLLLGFGAAASLLVTPMLSSGCRTTRNTHDGEHSCACPRESKCPHHADGECKMHKDGKSCAEGKCGEGKCGEGKCGGEGSCGKDMKKKEIKKEVKN